MFSSVPGGWDPPVPGAALFVVFAMAMVAFALICAALAETQPVTHAQLPLHVLVPPNDKDVASPQASSGA